MNWQNNLTPLLVIEYSLDQAPMLGVTIPDYPLQNSLTAAIGASAQKKDNNQMTNMWAGQPAPKTKLNTAAEFFKDMIKQAEQLTNYHQS